MTKEEYLERLRADPDCLVLPDYSYPPVDWLAAAWEMGAVREAESLELARSVHWKGKPEWGREYPARLSEALNTPRVVELFLYLRGCSPGREAEFRPEFERAFARHAHALPRPLTEQEAARASAAAGTKEEYLRRLRVNAWCFPYPCGNPWAAPPAAPGEPPPPEWVAEAWELDEVQKSLVGDLARNVGKGLSLPGAFLDLLSEALRTEQVVAFFLSIRRSQPHREAEFRPEFERAFARHVHALPPPLTEEEVREALGFHFEEPGLGEEEGPP